MKGRLRNIPTPLLIICASIIFIATFTAIGMYSDRQIVDYRTDASESKSLGINKIRPTDALLRYDSNHYRNIVVDGYTSNTAAFFPLYPLLVSGVHRAGIPVNYALLAVSWFFCVAASLVTFYWFKFELALRKSKISPWQVMFLIVLFPTSFYFMLGYTESLFVFLTVSALYSYRQGYYLLAGALVALSTATRVQGGVVALFFLADYVMTRDWRKWQKLIPVGMSAIGIGAYMYFLWQHFGNPFEFILAQQYWGRLSGNVIMNLFGSLTPPYLWYLPILTIMLFAVYKKLGKIWFWYCLVFIAVPISSGRLDSLNRYMLAAPPLFLGFALWLDTKSQNTKIVYYATSAFLLAWNVVFFFNDYWVA
jgi:Gpi18-like mannosyltransferase